LSTENGNTRVCVSVQTSAINDQEAENVKSTGPSRCQRGVVQSDGKIIAVGAGGGNYFVTRLNTNGSADTSFGSGGSVSVDFGASEYAMVEVVDAEMMLGKKKAADLAASGSRSTERALR